MKRSSTVMTAVALAMALSAAPALAQERHDRQPSAHARSEGQRADPNRAAPRAEAPRAEPQRVQPAPRAVERPTIVRPEVVRPQVVRPEVARPRGVTPYYARPYYAPRPYYAHPYYARPYYARPYVFRPHLRLGFGVILGYPVPYAYAYPYPVPVYGYAAPQAPVVVGPGSTQYGGVSLEISPSDATVYVDGGYAGVVRDFDGTQQTLTLANGRHRVEISAPGYEPMTIDVDVVPGQIVPYQGSLQPLRY
jgi:hypothetical protein